MPDVVGRQSICWVAALFVEHEVHHWYLKVSAWSLSLGFRAFVAPCLSPLAVWGIVPGRRAIGVDVVPCETGCWHEGDIDMASWRYRQIPESISGLSCGVYTGVENLVWWFMHGYRDLLQGLPLFVELLSSCFLARSWHHLLCAIIGFSPWAGKALKSKIDQELASSLARTVVWAILWSIIGSQHVLTRSHFGLVGIPTSMVRGLLELGIGCLDFVKEYSERLCSSCVLRIGASHSLV